MQHHSRHIAIASRRSPLARAQAQMVGSALQACSPEIEVSYQWIETKADRHTHTPLADVGGKGLFTREIENILLNGKADLAVHSLKDLPANEITPNLTIAAVLTREDPRDCLISAEATTLEQLPQGTTLGTASPRRSAQIKRLRPDIQIGFLRGNLETRLRKILSDKLFDITLLAIAGLHRSGLKHHARNPIDPSLILPSAGQGALAVQCRADDHAALKYCRPLNDPTSSDAVSAERIIIAALQGDCHSPIAALAEPIANQSFRLRARVLSPDGEHCLEADSQCNADQLTKTAEKIASQFSKDGSDQLLSLSKS